MIKTLLMTCALSAALVTIVSPAPAQSQAMTKLDAKPLLHPLFSENAVLQRDRPLTIWGWTQPNADVTVKFGGGQRVLRADGEGRWSVPIRPRPAGGPYSLEVGSGGQTETRGNLMFGDVWLCSGQSNMEFALSRANNGAAEVADANYPNVRLLTVPKSIRTAPVETFEGDWKVCSPQTVGDFSAVGYFFGRKLNRELNVPIGLIDSSWGGTPAQTWVSKAALQTMPEMAKPLAQFESSLDNNVAIEQKMAAWWQSELGTKAGWQNVGTNDADWNAVAQPGAFEGKGFADFDGVMWVRISLDLPADWAGKELKLSLGAIDDSDTTFWNGEQVGATGGHDKPRVYSIAGAKVRAGRNVLAVRALDTGGGGGMTGPATAMFLQNGDQTIRLDGNWKMKASAKLADMPAMPTSNVNQNSTTTLYNGMIAPLFPGQIKGAIWYQGESDSGQPVRYQTLLPTLINDWRARFGAPTGALLPFYIVQLANFKAQDEQPGDGGWAALREAQSMTAHNVPDVGIAVITDSGEEKDIHPKNKQDVGLRLALQALKNTYGKNVQADGPTLRGFNANGDSIVVNFDNADGLTLKGESNRVFAIAGADGKYFWATPTVAGNAVTLHSDEVPAPKNVRFGWSDNPRASLYNSAGLPASPFRTDTD